MNKNNTLLYLVLGVGALGAWYWYKKNKAKNEIKQDGEDLLAVVIKEEEDKYGTPFNKEYRIVMPYQMVSKKVKEKGVELTKGRFAIQPEKVKEPLYI